MATLVTTEADMFCTKDLTPADAKEVELQLQNFLSSDYAVTCSCTSLRQKNSTHSCQECSKVEPLAVCTVCNFRLCAECDNGAPGLYPGESLSSRHHHPVVHCGPLPSRKYPCVQEGPDCIAFERFFVSAHAYISQGEFGDNLGLPEGKHRVPALYRQMAKFRFEEIDVVNLQLKRISDLVLRITGVEEIPWNAFATAKDHIAFIDEVAAELNSTSFKQSASAMIARGDLDSQDRIHVVEEMMWDVQVAAGCKHGFQEGYTGIVQQRAVNVLMRELYPAAYGPWSPGVGNSIEIAKMDIRDMLSSNFLIARVPKLVVELEEGETRSRTNSRTGSLKGSPGVLSNIKLSEEVVLAGERRPTVTSSPPAKTASAADAAAKAKASEMFLAAHF